MDAKERGPSFIRRERPRGEGAPEPRRDEGSEQKRRDARGRAAEEEAGHRAGERIVIPRQDRGERPRPEPDIELREVRRGMKPGDTYLRVVPGQRRFTRVAPGYIEATRLASRPPAGFDRILSMVKGVVLGSPFATAQAVHERLSRTKALAVVGSDPLSSSTYATEEALVVLALAGSAALVYSVPIAAVVALLLIVVTLSYRETVLAYPTGGGAYNVAAENLGRMPALVAASSLVVDYIMLVSVSVSAGVAAITSAVPALSGERVLIGLGIIGFLSLGNLRGIRESGSIFAAPTYFFLVSMTVVILVGFIKVAIGDAPGSVFHEAPSRTDLIATQGIGVWLVLRAFSSGSTALTGVEAIANSVPMFKEPEPRNARSTLTMMAAIGVFLFLGITYLSSRWGLAPSEDETIVSQLGREVLGENVLYYTYQVATASILFLAANTSFSAFPVLGAILAKDRFMPRQFHFRGDRLGYSNGIVALALSAALFLVVFEADVTRLIPLYAVGVFVPFALSQSGMVRYWWRKRTPGWLLSFGINLLGASATAVVAVIIAATKFTQGAWISILLMAVLVVTFVLIRRHYDWFARSIRVEENELSRGVPTAVPIVRAGERDQAEYLPPRDHVIVPVDGIHRISLRAIGVARELSRMVTAVHLTDNREEAEEFRERWQRDVPDVPLQIIESPYRQFVAPMLEYLHLLANTEPQRIVVVLPGFVPRHWWERLLHNRDALRLRPFLSADPGIRLVDFPYRLSDEEGGVNSPGPAPGPTQTGS